MPYSVLKAKTVDVKVWVPDISQVESGALTQLRNTASLPWAVCVCAMPDVHQGTGATVGSVVALRGAISPATVSVDIGCGMLWTRTNLVASDLPDDLKSLRLDIEAAVPVNYLAHAEVLPMVESDQLWSEFKNLDEHAKPFFSKARLQCGTLGSGNHFIEVVVDEEQRVGVMLHSGSRNIGKELATVHIERAKKLAHNVDLPDRDLAVFLAGTPEMAAYRRDLFWAQRYALLNRRAMLSLVEDVMRRHFPRVAFEPPVQCHHNYVAEETWGGEELLVTRKGAIRAGFGDLGIIPGSMGAKSYIVRGKGNPESLCSASHGAGRKMSRGEAKRRISVERLIETTKGVECRKDAAVRDEAPDAYKDIDEVMRNQEDLVEVVHTLKQVLCVKGGEKGGDRRPRGRDRRARQGAE